MNTALLIVASVFIGLAALIHVAIFALESISWSKPTTWRQFGLKSQLEADTVAPMAFNQGFYNLFLALGAVIGLVLLAIPPLQQAGLGIALFAVLSMALAATVLVGSRPKLARAAAVQGVAPLLGSAALLLALASG